MKISIVVPAFNEEKLLPQTLEAVRAAQTSFQVLGWSSECIVCDNNSTDQTSAIAGAAGVKVVFEPVNQISRARNSGAQAATGQWLIFVDADSTPTAGLFQEVAEVIRRGRVAGGGSTLRMPGGDWAARGLMRGWNLVSRLAGLPAGSFIFCEKRLFDQLGGFSLNLYAGEELDFAWRLKALARREGKRVRILSRHPLRTSARKLGLYSYREHLRFFWLAVWRRGKNLREKEACTLWYDGRR